MSRTASGIGTFRRRRGDSSPRYRISFRCQPTAAKNASQFAGSNRKGAFECERRRFR
jgi:hypothetical protein